MRAREFIVEMDRRGFLKGLAGFAASAAVPSSVVKMLSTPAGVSSLSTPAGVSTLGIQAGLALLKGVQDHLGQWSGEDDDDYYDAHDDMAYELGFSRDDDAKDADGDDIGPTEQMWNLLALYDKNPEQAAQQLIKHIQSKAINPADVKASFKSRADDPNDWRYHDREDREEREQDWYDDEPAAATQAQQAVQQVATGPGTLARAATVAKAGIDKLSEPKDIQQMPAKDMGRVEPTAKLPAPTKPEVELPVNVKQKQAELTKRQGDEVAESITVERDGITLKYQFGANKQKLKITASSNGRRLGSAVFQNYGPKDQPQFKGDQVDVDERYRGQGIATVMYDLAKELVGRIYPSPSQTADGEAFWKGKPVWEQELNEFDPGEGGFGPFKVYYEQDYLIGQFPTYDEAKGEVDFLRDSDPKSATHHWRIVDGTGETVWEYDIGDEIDYHRHSKKFQRRP